MITIELLGKPQLVKGRQRLRPGVLLRSLAAAHPNAITRDSILASLYGDVPHADRRNRFRVALTRLRRSVPLVESEDRIGLNASQVLVDVAELTARLQEVQMEPDEETEARALEALLPQLGTVLFPGGLSEWEVQAQAAWSQTACAALERLSELAELSGDNLLIVATAEATMRHYPYDGAAWERYLRAMSRLARGAEAARCLASARRQARIEGWDLPDSLEAWTPQGDAASALGPELSPGESQALERFFRRAITTQPELAVEMIGSPSFRPEVLRSPRAVLPLLREVLHNATTPSEARERIQVRIISALSLLEEYEEVVHVASAFLEQPLAPARRRITLLAASFAHAMQGDLDRAMAAVDEAMSLASGPTAAYDLHECRAQRGTFLMLAGHLTEAESELRASKQFLEDHPLEGAEPDRLTIGSNLGLCLVHQARYPEAIAILDPVVESARRLSLPAVLGLSAPILGFAISHRGGAFGSLLVEGLRAAYRISPRRAVTAAAYAGRALDARNSISGRAVLSEALTFRMASRPPLNWLEQDLFAGVLGQRSEPYRPLANFVRDTIRACARVDGGLRDAHP